MQIVYIQYYKTKPIEDGTKQRPHKVPLLLQIRLPDFAQFEGQNGARREQSLKEVPFVMPFTIEIIIYVQCLNMIKRVQKHVSPFHARSGVFSPGEFDPPSSSAEGVFFLKFCKKKHHDLQVCIPKISKLCI